MITSAPETFIPGRPHLCKDGRRRLKLRIHVAGLAVLARRVVALPLSERELEEVVEDVQCHRCGMIVLLRWRDVLGMV